VVVEGTPGCCERPGGGRLALSAEGFERQVRSNPLAFRLPKLWPSWMNVDQEQTAGDDVPAAADVQGVPGQLAVRRQ